MIPVRPPMPDGTATTNLYQPKLFTILREGYGAALLQKDLLAGLTVAIVALPLSMAIAVASGVSPERGLYTAIVGGFVVSALGGSRFQIGGPAGPDVQFSIPGRGAPPPPREHGYGWNDGPAPGHPPPHWEGPPPPGGWDGPPPPGGWNRPWDGPPRDMDVARRDFGPFNYNTFTAVPVFNWQYGGWGYWFFGVWVPLY